jgi:hypothetical protein
MSGDRFLYCCNCNQVHHVSPFDQAPIFEREGAEIQEIPADDRQRFTERHSGHVLQELFSIGEKQYPSSKVNDPMADSYLPVSNGRENLILRCFRRSITEPMMYEVLAR